MMLNSQIEERQAPSFFQKHKFTLISVAVLVLALIPLIFLTRMGKKSPSASQATTQTAQVIATPTTPPLTQQNAQPTLDATDQQMQQALDESQTEINTVDQINTSADSTSGL